VTVDATSPLLAGKVVLVTGAAGGIGRAVAELAGREGARLVLSDLGCDVEGHGSDPSLVASVAHALAARGVEVAHDASDLSLDGTAAALVAMARERFGRIDAVVSCAGIAVERSVLKTDDALLARVLDVHVRPAFALTRAAGAAMVEQKEGGAIVLASGAAAHFGARGQAAIGAAHAALLSLARSASLELRRHEIRVNAIVPTARTRATEQLPTFESIPAGAMSPEHVASLTAFLISSLAVDVNGEVLGIAGARTYAFRTRETAGAFAEGGPPDPRWYREHFRDAIR
jgi:NAD(P)-dependent dehydrogenase (short-subunit alcohol dehydrogenase family)